MNIGASSSWTPSTPARCTTSRSSTRRPIPARRSRSGSATSPSRPSCRRRRTGSTSRGSISESSRGRSRTSDRSPPPLIHARGRSELIVESPRHDDTLATMDPEQLEDVLWMYRDRLLDLKRDSQIRDILVSRRHKKPGVSHHHPYSRVTAIPIVFDEKRRELR